jgi:hypothetical protein
VYDEKVSKLFNDAVSTVLLKNAVKTYRKEIKKFNLILLVSERRRAYEA